MLAAATLNLTRRSTLLLVFRIAGGIVGTGLLIAASSRGQVLAAGTPREVQTHPGVIEAYLGSVEDMSSLRRSA